MQARMCSLIPSTLRFLSAIVVTCRHCHEVEVGVQGAAVDGVKRHPYIVHAASRLQIEDLPESMYHRVRV